MRRPFRAVQARTPAQQRLSGRMKATARRRCPGRFCTPAMHMPGWWQRRHSASIRWASRTLATGKGRIIGFCSNLDGIWHAWLD